MSRKAMCFVSRLSLGLLLFTYLAFAVQACVVPPMSPAAAIGAESTSEPCHPTNDNLCLAQCLQSDETLDSHPAITSAPAAAALVTHVVHADTAAIHVERAAHAPAFGPPFYLRVCKLLR